ncbi:MAG TPA: radical SAM protein [Candidatus Margulisiibacteriota bacterium]|nr:radical SAM protein [Candidatus Margulisiibacteriota bacterium]
MGAYQVEVRITRRVKVVTGFRCNADCMFCYYKNRLKEPNLDPSLIKKDLDFAFRQGIREVDFSGGEPTIHPHLGELIGYAKKKGFEKVCIITNGIALANKDYYKSLVEAGLDETLFSVQGHDKDSHDHFVNVDDAFRRMMAALENAYRLGQEIRTNTVVHKKNHADLLKLCKIIVPFKPLQVNFIVVNDWECARVLLKDVVAPYSEVASSLKGACDFLKSYLENINVRYIPFCMMKGYEKYLCDVTQLKYDPYEWVPWVRTMLEKHYRWYLTLGLIGFGFLSHPRPWQFMGMRWQDILDDCIINGIRKYGYRQNEECRRCSYQLICDGLERTYAHLLGFSELNRVEGDKVREPYHFRTHLFR